MRRYFFNQKDRAIWKNSIWMIFMTDLDKLEKKERKLPIRLLHAMFFYTFCCKSLNKFFAVIFALFTPSKMQVDFWNFHNEFFLTFKYYFRFAYVVVRTTGNSTALTNTSPVRTEPISHIPTIASSNKIIKGKQSKDDLTKRASVRRTTIGRSKLSSRSPVKPLTCTVSVMTPTYQTVTTTVANSLSSMENQPVANERITLEDLNCKGPVTRSRLCKLCPSLDDSSLETLHKRGKRSLSSSRFYDKKNTCRKKQILTPVITGTSITRRLRKEASLDSALADVATCQETNDHNSLSEVPSPIKEAPKSRLKKPSIRTSSQKTLTLTSTSN